MKHTEKKASGLLDRLGPKTTKKDYVLEGATVGEGLGF